MPQWLVLGISGVTCGGKTTLARSLRDYFKTMRGAPLWNTPYTIGEVQLISQDDYFLPVDDLRHKWNEKLNAINFELITSLDMKQMLSDISWTIKGGRYLGAEQANIDNLDYMSDVQAPTSYTNFEHYALQFQQQYQQQQQHQQQQQQQMLQNSNYTHNGYYQHQHPQHHKQQQQQQQHQHSGSTRYHQHHHHHHQQQQQHNSNSAAAAHLMRLNAAQFAAQLRDKKINVLIIEGFMIFNQPELLSLCNLKFHFHLPYEKCYERRRTRTYDPPDVTGYFEMCVWPYYEKNFAEYRDCSDITFLNGDTAKEKIFSFVLQRIVNYFEERCDKKCIQTAPAQTAPQKIIGMVGTALVCSTAGSNLANMSNGNSMNATMPKACPMEHQ